MSLVYELLASLQVFKLKCSVEMYSCKMLLFFALAILAKQTQAVEDTAAGPFVYKVNEVKAIDWMCIVVSDLVKWHMEVHQQRNKC